MAAHLTHQVGDVVGPPGGPAWQVESLLGRGSYGTVYCVRAVPSGGAEPNATPQRATLKEMHVFADPAETAAALEHFKSEAALLARLDHPRIPKGQLLVVDGPFAIDPRTGLATGDSPDHPRPADAIEVPRRHYLVMTIVDGVSLTRYVQQLRSADDRLPAVRVVLVWVRQMASALGYLHGQHLIHRDVKPDNIVIAGAASDDPRRVVEPMLIDFGLCRPWHAQTGYGTQPFIRIAYNRANSHRASQCGADTRLSACALWSIFIVTCKHYCRETITIPVQ